ncbi:MAG: hypothetical protein WCW13_03470 [archaeon]
MDKKNTKTYYNGIIAIFIGVIFLFVFFFSGAKIDISSIVILLFSGLLGVFGFGSFIKPDFFGPLTELFFKAVSKHHEATKLAQSQLHTKNSSQLQANGDGNTQTVTYNKNYYVKEDKKTFEDAFGKSDPSFEERKALIEKIGSEKLSQLLHKAKILAIQDKNKDFIKWINMELGGYPIPEQGTRIGELHAQYPEYRLIQGQLNFQLNDGSIRIVPVPMRNPSSIKEIEQLIQSNEKKGGDIITRQQFDNDWPDLVRNKELPVEIPLSALHQIKNGAEEKLSEFLEATLK